MRPFLPILAAVCLVAGCGPNARKNFGMSEPEQSLSYHRGIGGASLDIRNPTNSTLVIRGAKVDPTTKALTIDYLEATSDASGVRVANVEQMKQNAAMYPLYTALQAQYGANTVNILRTFPEIITSATPLLGPWLNSLGQAKVAAATRPGVVMQLAELVKSGTANLDLISNTFKAIDPALAADVAKAAPVSVQSLQPIVGPN